MSNNPDRNSPLGRPIDLDPNQRHRSMMEASSDRHLRPTATERLHRRTRSLGEDYSLTPIDKHYALSSQLLSAFDLLYHQQQTQIAYVVGLQFIEMALLEIPKHGYYFSSRHSHERQENNAQAQRVAQQLSDILLNAEYEPSLEDVKIEKLSHLAQQGGRSSSWDQYERERLQTERELAELKQKQQQEQQSISAFPCMDAGALCAQLSESFSESICPARPDRTTVAVETKEEPQDSQAPFNRPSFTLAEETEELERALFLSGMEMSLGERVPSMASTSSGDVSRPRTKSTSEIDILSLRKCYHEDFEELKNVGRIRISRLDTYQGRLPESVNGCTVIAPLLCLHHFSNFQLSGSADDPGLPDVSIRQVIDKETPTLLPEVRTKLGLTKDALIIPSDVHDYIIEKGMLSQNQFVNVCGGNILDDKHIHEFWKILSSNVPLAKRVAATFFFHEHVISIMRMRRANGEVWYDIIDSLPYEEFLSSHDVVDDEHEREGPESGTLRSMESDLSSSSEHMSVENDYFYNSSYIPYAVRIRCTDEEAFKATLLWYACSKFNSANRKYIDMYNFDEQHSDFDPRVFQAFIWKEA